MGKSFHISQDLPSRKYPVFIVTLQCIWPLTVSSRIMSVQILSETFSLRLIRLISVSSFPKTGLVDLWCRAGGCV